MSDDTPIEFNLSEEAHLICKDFGNTLNFLYAAYASRLMDEADMPIEQALGSIAHVLIRDAAFVSIKNRAENLNGIPNIKFWRAVNEMAWNSCLEAYEKECAEKPADDEFKCGVCGEVMAKDTDHATECGRDDCPLLSKNADSQDE